MRVAGRHQPQSQAASRFIDHGRSQFVHAHLRALHERSVTDHVDDARHAARVRVHQVECRRLERHCRRPACHPEAMRDVRLHLLAVQRLERCADGDALIELTHLGGGQHVQQTQLSNEHDLEQVRFVGFQVRDDADLLEHLHRQVLCLVDDQHRAAMDRHQRKEELVQRADQLVLACGGNPAGPDALSRDDPKVEQHLAQQFFDREERIENQ